MAQPEVVNTTVIPRFRTGPMLKIKDLSEESNLKNNIDIIAVIAKIGEMKMSTQSSKVSVPAREIYLCDDSWAMIKLIVREFYFADNNSNLKSDQIIYIKNVRAMKLRGYTVLATMPDTLLIHEIQTPEAISLRFWLSQNSLEFKDGLTDFVFKRFMNLSSLNIKKPSAGSLENLNKESSQSSQSTNSITSNQTNGVDDNKNTSNTIVTAEIKRKHSEEKDVNLNFKLIKLDLKSDLAKSKDTSTIGDLLTQRVDSDPSGKMTVAKDSETVINISDDENTEEKKVKEDIKKVKEDIKKEVLEKEESDIEVVDDDRDLIISDTYSALMNASPSNIWNKERDKYLINFLSKHCSKQITHDMYLKLFEVNQNIFQGFSIEELKNRAEILATAKHYIYLLQLCGGEKIKTEKEKCTFIDRVEQLRRLIRSKEIKEEIGN